MAGLMRLGAAVLALYVTLVFCGLATGVSAAVLAGTMARGAFGSALSISETLARFCPIVLCAVGTALPAAAGRVNIGVPGQLLAGMLATAWLSAAYPTAGPGALALGAVGAGFLVAALPALARERLEANEALIGLFLTYALVQFVAWAVHGPLRDPTSLGWPESPLLPDAAQLVRTGALRLHLGEGAALLIGLAVAPFLRLTQLGSEIRVIGLSPDAARVVGIRTSALAGGALLAGGAIAGLAGYFEIAGVEHRLRAAVPLELGYAGFLVALMCVRAPIMLVPLAMLVAALVSGADALQVSVGLPAAVADVAEGALLLAILAVPRMEAWRRSLVGAGT